MDSYKESLESKIGSNMMSAIKLYVEERIVPGGFLTAVICNNLKMACASADYKNKDLLNEYVQYFSGYCPSNCWGSTEKFNLWLSGNN